jgi:hypothetical protein
MVLGIEGRVIILETRTGQDDEKIRKALEYWFTCSNLH